MLVFAAKDIVLQEKSPILSGRCLLSRKVPFLTKKLSCSKKITVYNNNIIIRTGAQMRGV